ncbi:MAG: hypothetical protein P1U89_09155 [Verrucomicrobiales bacterium]|nr:hypothetical protein [Verrucomicrobiales bacterium]
MKDRRVEIFCPKCQYHPLESDRWQCTCGVLWNTFDTNGNCPECGKVHSDTQCPACGKWSPHHTWYHEFNSDEVSEKEPLHQTRSS